MSAHDDAIAATASALFRRFPVSVDPQIRTAAAHAAVDAAAPILLAAHRALVADLRALHVREVAQRQTGHGENAEGIWLCAECLTEYPCRTRALLDRHDPEGGR